MGFLGQNFVFDSPAQAVEGMSALVGGQSDHNPVQRGTERIPLTRSRGRILAQDVPADRDSPPFDYSAMDGYAVCLADLQSARPEADGRIHLPVVSESRIGTAPAPLQSERLGAVRIATGAALPGGADAVLKREDVTEHSEHAGTTVTSISIEAKIPGKLRSGEHIRRRGENARAGEVVLARGELVTAAALGTLAAVGCVEPTVYEKLRVAIITTGDELVPPEHVPGTFAIRNSNAPALAGVLGAHRWIDIISMTHIRDDDDLAGALRRELTRAEAVILTGGVSMGHRDPVRSAIEDIGARILFHGLPQRPGKPMLGAAIQNHAQAWVPIFGLPGNPISAMVTCVRVAVPVLAACAGVTRTPVTCRPGLVEMMNHDGKKLDLWWHRLVRLNSNGQAELVDSRGSGDMISGGFSDGFVELAPEQTGPIAAFYSWPV